MCRAKGGNGARGGQVVVIVKEKYLPLLALVEVDATGGFGGGGGKRGIGRLLNRFFSSVIRVCVLVC